MRNEKTKNRKQKPAFLYAGLIILLIAFIGKWSNIPEPYFWILLGIAIMLKTLFLISMFRVEGFKPSLWLYFILAGVAMMLISMLFSPTGFVFHKTVFYFAILLKTTGLILMLFSKFRK